MSAPPRILLAEDNPADVWLIREALKRQAIACCIDNYATAADAIEAVLRCGAENAPIPDLILVDVNLPAGHGSEVLEAAASNPQLAEVPKAVLSSYMRPQEQAKMRALGALCFIPKPAPLHEFLQVVGTQVGALLRPSCAAG